MTTLFPTIAEPQPAPQPRARDWWIGMQTDISGAWHAVLLDGSKHVTGAIDPCPWSAAQRVAGYGRNRMEKR